MIGTFRNFAKSRYAGILVGIIIIPFVFWGMGSVFSSGNTNSIAKINKENISTQDFIDHINQSNIPTETIRNNLDQNIIEELLSSLVSNKFSSDSLGRVGNCKNVHVVDASVLPDVNIGPVTKLIMANSFRIGKEMNKQ